MNDQVKRGFRLEVALREFCRNEQTRALFEQIQQECHLVGVWWKHADVHLASETILDLQPLEGEDQAQAEQRIVYHSKIIQGYRMLWRELKKRLEAGDCIASGMLLPNGPIKDLAPSLFKSKAAITSLTDNEIRYGRYAWIDVRVRDAGQAVSISQNDNWPVAGSNIVPIRGKPEDRIQESFGHLADGASGDAQGRAPQKDTPTQTDSIPEPDRDAAQECALIEPVTSLKASADKPHGEALTTDGNAPPLTWGELCKRTEGIKLPPKQRDLLPDLGKVIDRMNNVQGETLNGAALKLIRDGDIKSIVEEQSTVRALRRLRDSLKELKELREFKGLFRA